MLKRFLLGHYIVINLCFSAAAIADNNYIKPDINIQHWETKHHVPVYFVAVKELPIIDIGLAINAGSARDGDKPGLAYLTNKMLIEKKSAASATGNNRLADIGALYHRHVDRDKAVLHLRSTSVRQEFNLALRIFETTLNLPAFTEQNLQHQQHQLRNKIQKAQDSPRDKSKTALLQLIYQQHPYAHSPLGTEQSVQTISLADIKNFYNQYYTTENLTIAIVGRLDQQQAATVAEKISSAFAAGTAAPTIPPATTALPSATIQRIAHPSSQAHIAIGEIGITPNDPDFYPLIVGNQILGGGALISRLGNEVRLKRGLAYSVSSHLLPWQAKGPFIVNVQTHHSQTETALHLAQDVLLNFVQEGPNQQELEAAKQKLIGNFPILFDSNIETIHQLIKVGFYKLPLDYFNTYQDKLNAVTIEQVKTAFQRHIDPHKLAITITGGNKQ